MDGVAVSEEIIRKTYICPIIGTGTRDDPRRPKIADLPIKSSWFIHELGKSGVCLCTVVALTSEHDKIALDPEVRLIAARKNVQIPQAEITALKAQYADFDSKFESAKKCRVKFMEEYGE